MPPHPLTNFEIKKYYQNEPRFNGVFSGDNLPKIKVETYFDSFGVEHIAKEIKNVIANKSMKTNIFRIQTYDSIMCGYFCVAVIDFVLVGKTLTKFTNLLSQNNFKKMMI